MNDFFLCETRDQQVLKKTECDNKIGTSLICFISKTSKLYVFDIITLLFNLDCYDGSDEHQDCIYFHCGNADIISASYECNGQFDCSDHSDEHENCTYFQCKYSDEVINKQLECNHKFDCEDYSDEHPGCDSVKETDIFRYIVLNAKFQQV